MFFNKYGFSVFLLYWIQVPSHLLFLLNKEKKIHLNTMVPWAAMFKAHLFL